MSIDWTGLACLLRETFIYFCLHRFLPWDCTMLRFVSGQKINHLSALIHTTHENGDPHHFWNLREKNKHVVMNVCIEHSVM